MSDNRELKLTVVVDDSNLKDFRQQLLDWKKDFPKDAKATSGKITTAFEEIADAAKSSNAAIRSLVAENSSTLSKMSTALDSVTSAMVGVQAAFDRFEKLGGKMKAITDAVTTVQGATKQLEADLKTVPARVESELAKVSTAVKGRAKKLKDDLAAQKPAEIKVAAEFDAEKLLKHLQGIKSEISKLGTKIKNIKISPKLDAKPVTAGLKQIQEQLALLSAVQKPIALSLDFDPLLAGLNRIEGSIGQLATSLAEQSERFAEAGKKSGEAFGKQLKEEAEEGAKLAATNAQKILNARFLAKGATAQLTETLQAQLAAAQGVNPEALGRRFSSFAIGDSLNFKAYMDSLDLQTKQLQAKVAQIMKAAVVAPYTYAGAEWWEKVLAEKESGIKAYFASLDPDTKQLQARVKQVMKAAVVAPYEYAGSEWWDQVLAEKDAGVRAYFDSLNPDTKKLESKVRQIMKAAVVAPYTYAGAEWWEKALSEKEAGLKAYFESLDPDTKQLQAKVKQVMKAAVVAPYTYAGAEWWEKVMAEQAAGAQKIVQQYNQIAATTQAARNRMLKVMSSADGGDAATFAMVNPGARIRDKFTLQEMAEFYRSGQSGGEALGLGPATEEVKKFNQVTGSSLTSNAAFKKSLDDMKFAARGVASGFNAMWLTWGNIAPLLVGAAISNAFVQAAKQGAALATELEFIAVLGGETAQSVSMLEKELLRLGNTGLFGPQQIAEGMRTMALAGVDAKTSAMVMGDAVNLATVGVLELKQASESMVGIANAFGLPFQALGRVGDVISKSAAVSQTSVQSITESMKTASVVAQRYGLSIEDTATALTVLGKLNITGTAAGTAFRNMIVGLTGNSVQAKRALEELEKRGFQPLRQDNTGKMKPLVELLGEFNTAMSQLDAKSYEEVMKALTTERGDKALSALIASTQKLVDVGGQELSEFQFLLEQITESYGFNAIAAARLATTTESEFKRVRAALQTSLVEAFNEAEPRIREVAIQLRAAFADPAFKQAISDITVTFARFTLFIVENRDAIASAAKVYVAYKAAAFGLSTLGGIGQTVQAFTNAMLANRVAATASASALTATAASSTAAGAAMLGSATKIAAGSRLVTAAMGPIGLLVGLAATAWALYADKSEGAMDAAANAAVSKGQSIQQYLDAENKRLREQIAIAKELKAEKKELVSLNQVLGIQELREGFDAKEKALKSSAGKRMNALYNTDAALFDPNAVNQGELDKIQSKLDTDLAKLRAERQAAEQNLKAAAAEQVKLAKEMADITKGLESTTPKGDETIDIFGDVANNYRNALTQFDRLEEQSADRQKDILDAKLKYKLISEESYLASLEQIKLKEQQTLLDSNARQIAEVKASGLKGEELKKQLELLEKRRLAVLENIATDRTLADLNFAGERNLAALKLDADLRKTTLKVTNDLAKAQAEFNAVAQAPEVAAADAARLAVKQDFSRILDARLDQEETLQEQMTILLSQEGELDTVAYDRLINKIMLTQEEIDKINESTEALANQAAQQARNNELLKRDPVFQVRKAVKDYYNELDNLGNLAGNVASQGLQKLEDAFTDFIKTGKFSASALFDHLKSELARFLTKQYVMKPIRVAIEAIFSSGAGAFSALFGAAGAANASAGLDGAAGDLLGSTGGLGSLVNGVSSISNAASLLSKLPGLLSGGIAGLETTIYNAFARGGAQLGITGTNNIALANAGTAAAGIGIAYSGYQLGRGISGGFSLNGGTGNGTVNAGASVGAILGAFAGGPFGAAVGSAIGSVIGGTVNRLFGRKTVYGASGIEGNLNADGLSGARSFQDVTLKGGLFRSSKSFTNFSSIDPKVIREINEAFRSVVDAARGASRNFGFDAESSIDNFQLSGRLGSNGQEVLTNAGAKLLDKIIADALADSAEEFKGFLNSIKEDQENLIDTYVRVSRAVTVANRALNSLSQAAQFSIVNAESAFKLLQTLGDNGVAMLDQFVQRFVPASEQVQIAARNFESSLKSLGLETKISADTTREEFRRLVQTLDLTSEAGQRQLQTLLTIMPELDAIITRREQEEAAIKNLSAAIEQNVERIRADFQGLLDTMALRTDTTALRITAAVNSITAQPVVDFAAAVSAIKPTDAAYRQFITAVGQLQPSSGQYLKFVDSISGFTPNTAAYKAFTDAVSGLKPTDAAYKSFVNSVSGLKPSDALYKAFVDAVSAAKPSSTAFTGFVTDVQGQTTRVNTALDLLAEQITALQNTVVTVNFTSFTNQINQVSKRIADIGVELAKTTDVGLRLQLEDQLQQSIVARYELEQQMLGGVFASIQELLGSIKGERVAVREAATEILGGPRVLSPQEIRDRVASISTSANLPTLDTTRTTQLSGQLAGLQANLAAKEITKSDQDAIVKTAQANYNNIVARIFGSEGAPMFAMAGTYFRSRLEEQANGSVKAINDYYLAYNTAQQKELADKILVGGPNGANTLLRNLATAINNFRKTEKEVATLITQTAEVEVALEKARAEAQQKFAEEIQRFVIDSGKAVSQLGKLREETVRYFQEQQRIAQAMTASSQGLRQTVADIRFADLNPQQQLAKLQAEFSKLFNKAVTLDGEALANAGNDLNNLIDPLLQKASEVFASGPEFQSIKDAILGQAETLASRIEALTPVNFQQESLMLLDTIDTTLALIEENTKSAEALIVEAIGASADRTVGALAEIYRGITGEEIPAFAGGGLVTGRGTGTSDSITARLSNGEYVMPASTVDQFGVPFMNSIRAGMVPTASSADNSEVVAELQEANRIMMAQMRLLQATAQQNANDSAEMKAELQALRKKLTTGANQ